MYINPVVVGIAGTLIFELIILIAISIWRGK